MLNNSFGDLTTNSRERNVSHIMSDIAVAINSSGLSGQEGMTIVEVAQPNGREIQYSIVNLVGTILQMDKRQRIITEVENSDATKR